MAWKKWGEKEDAIYCSICTIKIVMVCHISAHSEGAGLEWQTALMNIKLKQWG